MFGGAGRWPQIEQLKRGMVSSNCVCEICIMAVL